MNARGGAAPGTIEQSGPDERMKIDVFFADKVVKFRGGPAIPEGRKSQVTPCVAELVETCHVAHKTVELAGEALLGVAGNLESQAGRIATDVDVLKPVIKSLNQLVSNVIANSAAPDPLSQEPSALR